jgi:hypothetical protein
MVFPTTGRSCARTSSTRISDGRARAIALQNGGHQRVVATKWLRCCHPSATAKPT